MTDTTTSAHRFLPVERGAPLAAWTTGVPFEAEARAQRIARLPFIHRHVAVMPDLHLGIGATVGSVVATRRAIIPAAVGVDIGWGGGAPRTHRRRRPQRSRRLAGHPGGERRRLGGAAPRLCPSGGVCERM
jgi:hypothetical protein